LHRKPDEGLTILEKFEKYSNVGYAFILLTPDDIGYLEEKHQEKEKDIEIEHRARQNVIFEFGYFVGKLGRNRVCCIYKEGTTLSSDVSGLLYKKVRKSIEEVGYSLIKELTTAGYKLDINSGNDKNKR
jgi:predicted nucleotide-binding protein